MLDRLSLFAIAAITAFASPVAAQEANDNGRAGSVYARLGAGVTWVNDWDQDIAFDPRLAFAGAPDSRRRAETAASGRYAVAIGFAYPAGTRTELEYRYSSIGVDRVVLENPVNAPTEIVGEDIKAHFLTSNVYYDFHNSSAITPFVGVGVGGAFVEDPFGQRDAAFAYQARAGLSVDVSENWSLDVEYLYARTRDLVFGTDEFDLDNPDIQDPRFDGDNYESSSIMASIRKTF